MLWLSAALFDLKSFKIDRSLKKLNLKTTTKLKLRNRPTARKIESANYHYQYRDRCFFEELACAAEKLCRGHCRISRDITEK